VSLFPEFDFHALPCPVWRFCRQSVSVCLSVRRATDINLIKSVSQLFSHSAGHGRSVSQSVGQSVSRSVSQSVGRSVSQSACQSVGRSVSQSVGHGQSVCRSVGQSVDRSVKQSFGRSVSQLSTPQCQQPVAASHYALLQSVASVCTTTASLNVMNILLLIYSSYKQSVTYALLCSALLCLFLEQPKQFSSISLPIPNLLSP